jgi:hypothetical protein
MIAAGSLLAGCGDGNRSLSDEASAHLAPRVEAIRAAAAAGDRAAAQAEVGRVRQTLDDLQAAGAVDTAEAATVLSALAGVEQQLGLLPEPTTTTTATTAPAPAPRPVPPSDDGDEGEGPKKKKGREKDD